MKRVGVTLYNKIQKKLKRILKNGSPFVPALYVFKKERWAFFASIWMFSLFLIVLLGPFFLDTDAYTRIHVFKIYQAPSSNHWLGTDYGGRDIFSLLIIGTRNSLMIAFGITFFSMLLGVLLGMLSGYFKGVLGGIVMRLADFIASLPALIIFIVLVSILKTFSIPTFIGIIVAFAWVGPMRVIRAKALSECECDYIKASKTFGSPHWKILFLQLYPNLSSLVIVNFTLHLAGNIGIESTLSFIGFGLPERTPSLGTLVSYAIKPEVIANKWWVWLPASLIIFTMMLSIHFIGQSLKSMNETRKNSWI